MATFRDWFRVIQREVHDIACEKGWWDEPREFGTMLALVHSEVSEALEAAREGQGINAEWYKYTPPKPMEQPPGNKELTDALARLQQWVAGGYMDHSDPSGPNASDRDVLRRAGYAKPEGVPSELADIVIRVMDIAEFYDIDLASSILEKMEYNAARPHRHGGKAF